MQITNLKLFYQLNNNQLYHDKNLSIITNRFLSSTQKSEYKLYHKYYFRTDLLKDSLLEKQNDSYYQQYRKYSDFVINNKINYKNAYVKNYIRRASSLIDIFIGYVYFSNKLCEFFISCSEYNDVTLINGYAIKTNEKEYEYRFMYKKELAFYNPKGKVEYSSDELKENINKVAEKALTNS